MKPVRLPASATLTLPRLGLFALCLLYIFPGLINRDPWKINDDASSFGVMWTMAHGSWQDWLWPHVAGLPMPEAGPLSYWIGALCIQLVGWLIGDGVAARVSSLLFFAVGAVALWQATYALGRRPEAQPLQLAFGGQPEPKDFGRTLADGTLLFYLGSVGLLIHSHLTTPVALQVSLIAVALYAAIRLFETTAEDHAENKFNKPSGFRSSLKYSALLGITFGLLILTRGWIVPLALWVTCVLLASFRRKKLFVHLALITFPAAIGVAAIWLLSCKFILPFNSSPYSAWMLWNRQEFSLPSLNSLGYFLKYSAWFTWPAWPFAGWAVYAWRKQTIALHIALPLSFLMVLTALAICSPHAEQSSLIPLIPPLSLLAAFGLPTMKRGAINAVDWFSVIAFSLLAIFIWLHWIAVQTGWPVQFRHNVVKSVPGFIAEFNSVAFVVALFATCAWLKLVHWRIARHPGVLWRAVVLSSAGVILCWLLAMTLWMPWIDYRISYQPLAQEIAAHLPPPSRYNCVEANISPAQRASFAYFGKIRFADFDVTECDYFLAQDRARKPLNYPTSKPIWKGHRASDKTDEFTLFKRH